jgi:hydroxypyruvate reductase
MPSIMIAPGSALRRRTVPDHPHADQDLKAQARSIFTHALADCSIDRSFDRLLHPRRGPNGNRLIIDGEQVVALDRIKRVRIVSLGKASAAMLTSLLSRLALPPTCDVQGVLIARTRPENLPAAIQFFPGGHPLPNEASLAGATAALAMLRERNDVSPDNTLYIFLVSGGASAMMELPLDPSISLPDTILFHQALVHSGASIVEINCVRKHFSAVKGGRLALAAGNTQKLSLFVSDVPPTHLDALASGPTLPDPTTIAECREIIARYKLLERFPASVRRFFESPGLPETPKPGQLDSPSWKLLDSDELARAAQIQATHLGFHAIIDNTCDDWAFDAAADYLLDRLRQLHREHPRACLISTGEVTVHVPAHAANAAGGRNQHFALYLATQLRAGDAPIAILSAGSDGIDGNSLAAGAVIDQHTFTANEKAAQQALAAFTSSTFLESIGATIVTGPTGHNLRDLRILLAG